MSRKSLHVGINYTGTHAALRGCVNDAMSWQAVAVAKVYQPTMLLEREATKDKILGAFSNLMDGVKWGDRRLATVSSHGTNIRDTGGDEADGRDEALVAYGMTTITDDDLHAVIGTIPRGVRLTIIPDSCYSGTMARFARVIARPDTSNQVRYLDPSFVTVEPSLVPRRSRVLLPAKSMWLTGCSDDEVAYDALIEGRFQGAMTAAAIRTLPVATSMSDWRKRTVADIRYPQTPQLTATSYQRRLKPLA